jgi:membrane protein YqaA with SNARE-associated domain
MPQIKSTIFFFFYVMLSNSFIGIPHEPLMIYVGKLYPFYIPVLIAIIPTILGCYLDYLVLTPVLNSRLLRKPLNSNFYTKSEEYFKKFPYITLFFFALTPLPFYPVRILSVASRYPLNRYVSSVTLGRIPRYTILVLSGTAFNISNHILLVILLFMMTSPLLISFTKKLLNLIKTKFTIEKH